MRGVLSCQFHFWQPSSAQTASKNERPGFSRTRLAADEEWPILRAHTPPESMKLGALKHYEVLRPLGRGGMGEVYLALDTTLGRQVAIKVLPEDLAAHQDDLDRFAQEARTVAALNHPNIVTAVVSQWTVGGVLGVGNGRR